MSSYSSPSSTISVVDGANSGDKEYASPPGTAMLVDSQADQPASSADTFSFTVDVSACMASKGTTFPVGQSIGFDISANSQSSHDHSNQTFWLERTS